MKTLKERIHFTSLELEQIARCPHSINYIDRINASKACKRCEAFSEIGRFILQRNFRGGNLPTQKGVENAFSRFCKKINYDHQITAYDKVMLHDLLVWGKGISDQINLVSADIVSHFGLYTVEDTIDAIIDDMDVFTIVQIICNEPHHERVMNYRALHASYWLRNNYNIEKNNLMMVKMTQEGVRVHRYNIPLSTELIKSSILHILSGVDGITPELIKDEEAIIDLPVSFGEHCWKCMACWENK